MNNKPSDRLAEVILKMQRLRIEKDSEYTGIEFLKDSLCRNASNDTIEKIIADYEQHIVKYSGEDHMLE